MANAGKKWTSNQYAVMAVIAAVVAFLFLRGTAPAIGVVFAVLALAWAALAVVRKAQQPVD